MLYQLLLWSYILASFVQCVYWLFIYIKLAQYNPEIEEKNTSEEQEGVSIIICARNEAENLEKNLHRIVTQNYRLLEIITVDDASTDNTLEVLLKYQQNHLNFRVLSVSQNEKVTAGKKAALSKGIAAAKYDLLLLTDADCAPSTEFWVQAMQKQISGKRKIGLGYSPYQKIEKNFLNIWIRYEAIMTAIQYLSYALCKLPYMGVGRNLIYRKSLFHKVNGFSKHQHIASGDDDLFINQVANGENTCIILNQDAFVYSEPKTTYRAYYRQKMRHLTTATSYEHTHQILLGLYACSHLWHYLGGGVLIILKISTIFVTLIYVARILIVLAISRAILKRIHDISLLKWLPFLDACMVLYYIIFSPILIFGKTNRWN